ncbi:MAG TPA: substrate-binding domain-containing protein [Gaiellaceae bacterium]|nr:substrate-binding domain-containing protein [Gaiellaceae bacterium]
MLAIAAFVGATARSGQASAGAASAGKTVGIVDLVQSDPLNVEVIKGVTAAAKAKGWKVLVYDANGNADAANAAFKRYASQKVDMILDLAFPVTSVRAGLAAARAAKIPVGGWGSGLAPGILMTTVDDVGQPSANAVLKAMGGKAGKGSVLALFYTGGQVCRERQAVFVKTMKKAPNVKVQIQNLTLPGEQQEGTNYTNAWLAQHPRGSGNLAVWGCWDSPMYGAVAALRQQSRSDVKSFSINGSPQAIQLVKSGALTNEVWENGYQEGRVVFNTTLAGINAGKAWKPKTVRVPGIVVTKSNVNAFLKAKHK